MAGGLVNGYEPGARVYVVFGKDDGRTGIVVKRRPHTHWHLVHLSGDDEPTWIHYLHLKQQQEQTTK